MTVNNPMRTYDVLKPIIQTKDEGVVEEVQSADEVPVVGQIIPGTNKKSADTLESLQAYAKHLMETIEAPATNDMRSRSLSPNRILPRNRLLSPSSPVLDLLDKGPDSDTLSASRNAPRPRPGKGSFVSGDDELLEETTGCGQAVEVLSRHSSKSG